MIISHGGKIFNSFNCLRRKISSNCGSLWLPRLWPGAPYKSKNRGALGQMVQMAPGKSGPACGINFTIVEIVVVEIRQKKKEVVFVFHSVPHVFSG